MSRLVLVLGVLFGFLICNQVNGADLTAEEKIKIEVAIQIIKNKVRDKATIIDKITDCNCKSGGPCICPVGKCKCSIPSLGGKRVEHHYHFWDGQKWVEYSPPVPQRVSYVVEPQLVQWAISQPVMSTMMGGNCSS